MNVVEGGWSRESYFQPLEERINHPDAFAFDGMFRVAPGLPDLTYDGGALLSDILSEHVARHLELPSSSPNTSRTMFSRTLCSVRITNSLKDQCEGRRACTTDLNACSMRQLTAVGQHSARGLTMSSSCGIDAFDSNEPILSGARRSAAFNSAAGAGELIHRRLTHRVRKSKPMSMKRWAPEVAQGNPIEGVADDGQTVESQLCPNLMLSPREQLNLEGRMAWSALQTSIAQPGLFTFWVALDATSTGPWCQIIDQFRSSAGSPTTQAR